MVMIWMINDAETKMNTSLMHLKTAKKMWEQLLRTHQISTIVQKFDFMSTSLIWEAEVCGNFEDVDGNFEDIDN